LYGFVHRHADLADVALAQNVGKDHRVLVDHAVLVGAPLHQSVGNFVKVELLDVIGEAPRAV
jgi:hypothetical protein